MPRERAELLEPLDLPDAPVHDLLYGIGKALRAHDRAEAARTLSEMESAAPGHPLTLRGRLAVAAYDANRGAMLESVDGLLRLFPSDEALSANRADLLRDLLRYDERMALLRSLAENPRAIRPSASPMPASWRWTHGTRTARSSSFGRRSASAGSRPRGHSTFSRIQWRRGLKEEAIESARFAACLDDKAEQLALSYFQVACAAGRSEDALRLLEDRFRRLEDRSAGPAFTLFKALCSLDRAGLAFEILDEALSRRPEDGDLLAFAAGAGAERGFIDRADALLERAAGRVSESSHLRTSADVARARGALPDALARWEQVLRREPLDIQAREATVWLIAAVRGVDAALDHLGAACAQYPYHVELHRQRLRWTRRWRRDFAREAARYLVDLYPRDAWAHREYALILSDENERVAALAEAKIAMQIEPESSASWSVLGWILERGGDASEAMRAYREAVSRSADDVFAIHHWTALCPSLAEKQAAIAFVRERLEGPSAGVAGCAAYREAAAGVLDGGEILAFCRAMLERRPGVWGHWSIAIAQCAAMDRLDEAAEAASEAVRRFPLEAAAWQDLATVARCQGRRDDEISALRRALEIYPSWTVAARLLARALADRGDVASARQVLEDACKRESLDPENQCCRAGLLWRLGEKDAAVAVLERLVGIDPAHEQGWRLLHEYSLALDRDSAERLARKWTEISPRDPRSWLILGRCMERPDRIDECLRIVERALELDPSLLDAHDLKAALLVGAGRFGDAVSACNPPLWKSSPPLSLLGRRAWVDYQRGRALDAIGRMRMLLRDNPAYVWGWHQLAEWCGSAGDALGLLAAAGRLASLEPHDGHAQVFLGRACLAAADPSGAKTAFRRALRLDPALAGALVGLFDAHRRLDELDEAEAVIPRLEEAGAAAQALACEARIAAARKDAHRALVGLRKLCLEAAASLPLVDQAARAAAETAALGPCLDAIEDSLATGKATASAAGSGRPSRSKHVTSGGASMVWSASGISRSSGSRPPASTWSRRRGPESRRPSAA